MVLIIKNKTLSTHRPLHVTFTELKGMGRARGLSIAHMWGMSRKLNMSKVPIWFHKAFCIIPPKYFIMESPLDQQEYERLYHVIESKTYKCFRHAYSLPVHGQRTKTNAKTRKKYRLKIEIMQKIQMVGEAVEGMSKTEMKKQRKKTLRKERKKEEKKQQKYMEQKAKLMI